MKTLKKFAALGGVLLALGALLLPCFADTWQWVYDGQSAQTFQTSYFRFVYRVEISGLGLDGVPTTDLRTGTTTNNQVFLNSIDETFAQVDEIVIHWRPFQVRAFAIPGTSGLSDSKFVSFQPCRYSYLISIASNPDEWEGDVFIPERYDTFGKMGFTPRLQSSFVTDDWFMTSSQYGEPVCRNVSYVQTLDCYIPGKDNPVGNPYQTALGNQRGMFYGIPQDETTYYEGSDWWSTISILYDDNNPFDTLSISIGYLNNSQTWRMNMWHYSLEPDVIPGPDVPGGYIADLTDGYRTIWAGSVGGVCSAAIVTALGLATACYILFSRFN